MSNLSPEDIKKVVHDVLAEQAVLRVDDDRAVDVVAYKTVALILTSFGIDDKDRIEFKSDLAHLRKWRKSTEQVTDYGIKAIITVLISGFLGAMWLGVKAALGK